MKTSGFGSALASVSSRFSLALALVIVLSGPFNEATISRGVAVASLVAPQPEIGALSTASKYAAVSGLNC